MELEGYIGQNIRLTRAAFRRFMERTARAGVAPDNHFLVASVLHRAKALVCYGADMRIVFPVSDVVLL